MHPVAYEVDVPTERVERYLLQWAKPGFTGQRTIFLRVRSEAGLAVEFFAEGNEVDKVQGPRPNLTPPIFGKGDPTEREMEVGAKIAQNKHRFRIGTKLTRIVAHFVDGRLKQLEWGTADGRIDGAA